MSRRWWGMALALLIAAGLALPAEARRKKEGEPDRVVVQHVLISFKGAARPKNKERKKKDARDGEDFDALVEEYTDDRYPGIGLAAYHAALGPYGYHVIRRIE